MIRRIRITFTLFLVKLHFKYMPASRESMRQTIPAKIIVVKVICRRHYQITMFALHARKIAVFRTEIVLKVNLHIGNAA